MLNQVALLEAMAEAISQVARLSDWRPEMQPGYEEVPFSRCCPRAPALPRGFASAVRGTMPKGGGGVGGGEGRKPRGAGV